MLVYIIITILLLILSHLLYKHNKEKYEEAKRNGKKYWPK